MPKRVDHEIRRRQIGEALLRIASARGLHSASMREVAAEAGVSLRLVQYYFHTKEELLLSSLAYLGERLATRVESHIRAWGPVTPRSVVYGTLTAILPTDTESLDMTRAYTGYYTLVFTDPDLATRHGATYPDKLERLLAGQLSAAQQAGQIDATLDPETTAAGLLALTNGLGASVLGGQRDGETALAVLTYHIDRLFKP
ncbi:TetR/AcrR family transcriptional regulator [Micromonospora sp. WMMD1128]|uniref:TetR/AcrR family transcriptional regulator n=1 Tax=Micromonospora sp. WMMD1128 TaxID=3015150 RepID=UPI00248B3FC8|nr:TetR/AcrR family transcriptional regulator [Micromonospora sp. WMMD1128]WBB75999.1 TetR/AcrR family transcriptional regulator [Micromonospora sp. WMMD1128]